MKCVDKLVVGLHPALNQPTQGAARAVVANNIEGQLIELIINGLRRAA